MKIYREIPREEFEDLASRILYEDNHLLVVNKRVGEIVQGDKTGDEPLSEKYKAFIAQRDEKPGQVFMGLPHRLDRPVSGITVLAKTSKALERLNAMFRESDVHKIRKCLFKHTLLKLLFSYIRAKGSFYNFCNCIVIDRIYFVKYHCCYLRLYHTYYTFP